MPSRRTPVAFREAPWMRLAKGRVTNVDLASNATGELLDVAAGSLTASVVM